MPGYAPQPGYGLPVQPVPPKPPVWPWILGAAAGFVILLCLVGAGLFLISRDGRPSANAPTDRAERVAPGVPAEPPMPRMTPGEPTRLPNPPRVIGADVTVSGRGNKTVAVRLEPDAVYVASITHDGGSNFMVEGLNRGRPVGLIVNAIGDYIGERPVGLSEREMPTAIRVVASGTWKIVLRDLSKAPLFTGEAEGRQPAVFRVPPGGEPGRRITATHSGRDNFVVNSYGADDRPGLFINEIGRYRGTAALPPDTEVIEVDAQGGWTLTATP